jgi:pimeloyl-ACP methyl ester carboxylesterase
VATFVLVHGMWAGGWYWQKVRPLLRAAGHEVFSPTLTGLGERVHLARPEVDLDTHIDDVVNVMRYEDLRDVVLVGHSYAGMVIGGVADRAPERLARLVYLDAFVPEDGDCVEDFLQPGISPDFEAMAVGFNGWQIPTLDPEDEDPAVVAWEAGRTVPHPIATFRQPIRLSDPAAKQVPRVFIHCTEKPGGDVFVRFAERARDDPGWRYLAIDAVHDVMAVKPEELTEVLSGLV